MNVKKQINKEKTKQKPPMDTKLIETGASKSKKQSHLYTRKPEIHYSGSQCSYS